MLRALLRLASMVALAIACILAVLDATRSIALDAVTIATLDEIGTAWMPGTLASLEALVRGSAPDILWDPVLTGLLAAPAFAVFAAAALLLYLLGHKPRHNRRIAYRR